MIFLETEHDIKSFIGAKDYYALDTNDPEDILQYGIDLVEHFHELQGFLDQHHGVNYVRIFSEHYALIIAQNQLKSAVLCNRSLLNKVRINGGITERGNQNTT